MEIEQYLHLCEYSCMEIQATPEVPRGRFQLAGPLRVQCHPDDEQQLRDVLRKLTEDQKAEHFDRLCKSKHLLESFFDA